MTKEISKTFKDYPISETLLNKAQLSILLRKTPPEQILHRPGRGGKEFTYVRIGYVVDTLNQAFGHGNWGSEITWKEILTEQVLVQVRLSIKTKDGTIVPHDAFGGADIKRYTEGKNAGKMIDLADDLKAAQADAIKKAASFFGIALDVFADYLEPVEIETKLPAPESQVQVEKPIDIIEEPVFAEVTAEDMIDKTGDSTNTADETPKPKTVRAKKPTRSTYSEEYRLLLNQAKEYKKIIGEEAYYHSLELLFHVTHANELNEAQLKNFTYHLEGNLRQNKEKHKMPTRKEVYLEELRRKFNTPARHKVINHIAKVNFAKFVKDLSEDELIKLVEYIKRTEGENNAS